MTSKILVDTEKAIEKNVTKPNFNAYRNAVTAGMKILFDKKTHANMELIKNPNSRKDPVNTIAQGVAGLMWLLFQQSKKTMKPEVMIMAGVTLMTKVMDFAERGLGLEITNEIVAQTTKKLGENLFVKMGISPEQLQEAIRKGHQEILDYKSKQAQAGDV